MNILQFIILLLSILILVFFIGLGTMSVIDTQFNNLRLNILPKENIKHNKNKSDEIEIKSKEKIKKIDKKNIENKLDKEIDKKNIENKEHFVNSNNFSKPNDNDYFTISGINYKHTLPKPVPLLLDLNNTNPVYVEKNFKELSKEEKDEKTNPKMIYINPFFKTDYNNENDLYKPIQNYQDPSTMSNEERNAFKFGYPKNMTMQDYVNWLYLFKKNSNLLNLDHLINFQKLQKNIIIQYKNGIVPPSSRIVPPLNSDNYFNNMYNEKATVNDHSKPQVISSNLRSPIDSLIPYNYKNYPDFPENFNTLGNSSSIPNPDLYMKKNPKVIAKFIGPNIMDNNITENTI